MNRLAIARHLAVLVGAGSWLLACGTDAVGVSQCRTIEAARCRAGTACGLVEDVDACLRYSRDQCLHGTATAGTPKRADVAHCVELLDEARACALDSNNSKASDCGIDLVSGSGGASVCDVIVEPEKAQLCAFLTPEEEEPSQSDPDAGG
jgi:hypothetical protein